MSDNNLSQVQEIDTLKKKLGLLIKGLKEEKLITTKLKEENELLKYDLEEKKLLLKKTKEEYQELVQSKISPDKLSSFFNSLENNEIIDTPDKEKFNLKKENEQLKSRLKTLEEENKISNAKIKELEIKYESQISSYKDEITSLKNQLLSYKDSIYESKEKSSKLIDNIKYEKLVSNDREAKIVKLQKENESLSSNKILLKNKMIIFYKLLKN